MSNKPNILNQIPSENGKKFDPFNPISFSVRDLDTRINKQSVDSVVTFSRNAFLPSSLLEGYWAPFSRHLSKPRIFSTVDRNVEVPIYDVDMGATYGPVIVVEQTSAEEQSGCVFNYTEASNSPISMRTSRI